MPAPIPASWLRASVAMAKPRAPSSTIASQPRPSSSGSVPSVSASLRPAVETPAMLAADDRDDHADDERGQQPQADHDRDRGERQELVAAPALAPGDGGLERAPRPLGTGDRGRRR